MTPTMPRDHKVRLCDGSEWWLTEKDCRYINRALLDLKHVKKVVNVTLEDLNHTRTHFVSLVLLNVMWHTPVSRDPGGD